MSTKDDNRAGLIEMDSAASTHDGGMDDFVQIGWAIKYQEEDRDTGYWQWLGWDPTGDDDHGPDARPVFVRREHFDERGVPDPDKWAK